MQIKQQRKILALQRYMNRQYFKEETLEYQLWEHLKYYVLKGNINTTRLNREYIERLLFEDDHSSLNRTVSRLYQRLVNFMIEQYLEKHLIVKDWLFVQSLYHKKNRLHELMVDKLINDDRKPVNPTEAVFQSSIRFHLAYELYQERSLGDTDVKLFNKVRLLFNDYYSKYYDLLEIEKQQRVEALDETVVDLVKLKNAPEEKEDATTLLSKLQLLENHPHYFEYCKNEMLRLVRTEEMSKQEQLLLYPILLNFAIRQSNQGNKDYLLNNINDLLYLGFDKKILCIKEHIPINIYVNFLSLAASTRMAAPIKEYAVKYLEMVEPNELVKARFFTKIFIAFYEEDYNQVIHIINVNEDNVSIGFNYGMRMRIWVFLICSYYELRDEERYIKSLQSFRQYLKKQSISDTNRKINYNFVSFARNMYKMKKKSELMQLEENLKNTKDVFYKEWLLEKIKELLIKFDD